MRQRGSFQRAPEYSSRTGAESASRAWRAAGARSAARDLDRVDPDGKRNGAAALEPGERADDPALGRLPVELQSGLTRDQLDREPAADELRLDVVLIDLACQTGELVVQRGCVGLDRRHDLGAEEARLQPAEAAHGPEALSLAGGRLECGRPVGLDAERRRLDRIALASGREHDRHVSDLVEALLQQRTRLLRRQPAHVDAGDRDTVGEPRGRTGEREPDERDQDCEERDRDQDPARDQLR